MMLEANRLRRSDANGGLALPSQYMTGLSGLRESVRAGIGGGFNVKRPGMRPDSKRLPSGNGAVTCPVY